MFDTYSNRYGPNLGVVLILEREKIVLKSLKNLGNEICKNYFSMSLGPLDLKLWENLFEWSLKISTKGNYWNQSI